MPRTLITSPGHDRGFSLGWLAVAWMEALTVYGPGDVQGSTIQHGDEYTGFIADCYALRKSDGRMLYDGVFLSRPKGCDKSGLESRFALFEGLGPCRYAGVAQGGEVYTDPWKLGFEYRYTRGEPMGKHPRYPYIRMMATEEGQTGNVYDNVYANLNIEGPLTSLTERGIVDCGLTRCVLPDNGRIMPSTASSAAKDGGKETFVCFDETHLYIIPELRRMYETVTRNLRKRKRIAQTWYLEGTTMFAPGEESVAEATYMVAQAIQENRVRRPKLLYDHRWGDIEFKNLSNEELLAAAIVEAYGDAIEWNDVEGILDEFYNPKADVLKSRRFFLNAETSGKDAWLDRNEWVACGDTTLALCDGDMVVLGFDGSKREDSTALIITRVSDGFQDFLDIGDGKISCWEKPLIEGRRDQNDEWEVPGPEVDAAIAQCFRQYKVVGFYADPPGWADYIDNWMADFGDKLVRNKAVKATMRHPIEWWTNRPTPMVEALKRYKEAVKTKSVRHRKNVTFTRHALNAQRREHRVGTMIAKEYPGSPKKIDAVMAAVLSYEARMDAVAAGLAKPRTAHVPSRLR